MPDDIRIVPATEADLPAIRPLLLELREVMDNTGGFAVEQSLENCRVLIRNPAYQILLAKVMDKVAGLVNFSTRKTIMHPRPCGLVDELIVSRSHRGLGIGKQMLLAVIQKCRELECCEIEVSTEKSNKKAREFYQRCGFEEEAVLLEMDLE
jgi:ribosomal protein S18 acetylase RimI-like enzyme